MTPRCCIFSHFLACIALRNTDVTHLTHTTKGATQAGSLLTSQLDMQHLSDGKYLIKCCTKNNYEVGLLVHHFSVFFISCCHASAPQHFRVRYY